MNERRRHFVNASDVAVIIEGVLVFTSGSSTRDALFNRIVGLSPPLVMTEAMVHGANNEANVATMHANRTGLILFDGFSSIVHPLIPWMAASPDRVSFDKETKAVTNVEIKAPFYRRVSQASIATVDHVKHDYKHYWHQMQCQMFCMNLDVTDYVVCGLPPNINHPTERSIVYSCCSIPRDTTWWRSSRNEIIAFANRVYAYRGEAMPPLPPSLLI